MSDLIERLRNVENMINMGEKIRWGEETALMDQAADALEAKDALIAELVQALDFALHCPSGMSYPKQGMILMRAKEHLSKAQAAQS